MQRGRAALLGLRVRGLAYDEPVTREKLLPIANGTGRCTPGAKRMLKMIEDGVTFHAYPYPVRRGQIGDELLLIGIGGEAVVDYSLR